METEKKKFKISFNLPEVFWRVLIILLVFYAFFVVGKITYDNYNQNKTITIKEQEIAALRQEVEDLKFQNEYYKTATFKEKEARSKLGYTLPGETAVPVDYDQKEVAKIEISDQKQELKKPNYQFWIMYFRGN